MKITIDTKEIDNNNPMPQKRIGEHLVDIPEWREGMPLINEGLHYEDSYWKYKIFPKIFYDIDENTIRSADVTEYDESGRLLKISQSDDIEISKIIKEERYKMVYGIHIKIGDRIEWICPDYYFFLQWFQQKDIVSDENGMRLGCFRKIQNDILQLWHYVKNNKEIAGLIIPKIKKMGITYLFSGAFLNEAINTRNNDFLMMSKDFETCKLTLFTFIEYGYNELPYVFKPFASTKNKTEISFKEPKDRKHKNDSGRYLQNVIKATKTKVAAFDGAVPYRCWIDEFPKIWKASKVSVKETFDKSIEAVKKQQLISGKLLMTSYMPEEADQGFIDGRKLCENAMLRTIKEGHLRTENNMIIFPIYAYQSNQECFDKYGNCDEERATKMTLEERKAKTTKQDIQSHKRQYPMNWNDMFDNTGSGAAFDNLRLSLQLNDLKDEDIVGGRPYKEGFLRWENSMWEEGRRPENQFCKVYFDELTPHQVATGEVGRFKFYEDISEIESLKHILNRVVIDNIRENGLLTPHKSNLGVMSVDPTDYKLASDVREGSLNASYGGFIHDLNLDQLAQRQISNIPIIEYNYRDEDPDTVMEDMIKACLYLGFYIIIEGNKGWLYTEFRKHGLQNFLLVKQADGSITPWKQYAENQGGNKMVVTGENMIDIYMRAIKRYIAEPRKGETDWIKHIKSIKFIGQALDFDPMNTKKFDLVVAFGYWRVAIESFTIWRMNQVLSHREYDEKTRDEGIKLLNELLC
jgi:hypothetical protein